jgi:lipopolysaccharide/colanic/teichoic acid biosynthesis glycosyltransferase
MNRFVSPEPGGVAATCSEMLAQRAFDVGGALVALCVLAPLMLSIAALIWLESGRPIYFSQIRLGKGGRPFHLHKFRKFRTDCGSNGRPLTLRNDDRMTVVGRFLAMTKLDELPQFWNVLKGDMSLVGPRPESLAFVDCFSNGLERVLDYRPGLFGPSQVLFRHENLLFPPNVEPEDFYRRVLFPAKAKIDLEYFAHRSLMKDVGWIARCAAAVIGLTPPTIMESHGGQVVVRHAGDGADS